MSIILFMGAMAVASSVVMMSLGYANNDIGGNTLKGGYLKWIKTILGNEKPINFDMNNPLNLSSTGLMDYNENKDKIATESEVQALNDKYTVAKDMSYEKIKSAYNSALKDSKALEEEIAQYNLLNEQMFEKHELYAQTESDPDKIDQDFKERMKELSPQRRKSNDAHYKLHVISEYLKQLNYLKKEFEVSEK
ncbi:MAG: hypothetical protein K0B07_02130 [DPANN group archaeon]|nr:hypothetical protein [DPANN group archaeon]